MTLRSVIKTAAAEALSLTGADRLWGSSGAQGPLVLGYHRVVEDYAQASERCIPPMLISTRMLESHLDWLGRRFRIVSLDELADRFEGGASSTRPLAALTFDDGYRDFYEQAFPLLQRKGVPATVFVVTGLLGRPRLFVHDRLYLLLARAAAPAEAFAATRALLETRSSSELESVMERLAAADGLDEARFPELHAMSWEMVETMHRAGVTIGSHTRTHALLSHEGSARVRGEVDGSRQELERRLGAPIRHLAYPDGRFNGAVVDEVAAAGYRLAFTTCRHRDLRHPRLTVPRRLLWQSSCTDGAGRFSPALMRCQAQGVFDRIGRCRQDHAAPAPRAQAIPA